MKNPDSAEESDIAGRLSARILSGFSVLRSLSRYFAAGDEVKYMSSADSVPKNRAYIHSFITSERILFRHEVLSHSDS